MFRAKRIAIVIIAAVLVVLPAISAILSPPALAAQPDVFTAAVTAGSATTDIRNPVEFTVSIGGFSDVNYIDIEFETDNLIFEGVSMNGNSGFKLFRDDVAFSGPRGSFTVYNPAGLSSEGMTELLKLSFKGALAGDAKLTLVSVEAIPFQKIGDRHELLIAKLSNPVAGTEITPIPGATPTPTTPPSGGGGTSSSPATPTPTPDVTTPDAAVPAPAFPAGPGPAPVGTTDVTDTGLTETEEADVPLAQIPGMIETEADGTEDSEEEADDNITDVDDAEIPLIMIGGDVASWSLVSLILCATGLVLAAFMATRLIRQRNNAQTNTNGEDFEAGKYASVGNAAIFALAAGGAAVFLLTQDLTGRMVLINMWTIANAVIFAAQTAAAAVVLKRKDRAAQSV